MSRVTLQTGDRWLLDAGEIGIAEWAGQGKSIGKPNPLSDIYTSIVLATAKKIIERLDEPCKEHSRFFINGRPIPRKACPDCWQTLINEVEEMERK